MPIYMQYPGIEGDVAAGGHEKWIALDSCSFAVGRTITNTGGRSGQREPSAPSVSEVTVSKSLCSSSAKLLEAALSGEGKEVKIEFCKTEKDNVEPYVSLTLTNTLVSNYHHSAAGEQHPSETLSLNFTKLEYKHTPMDAENKPGSPVVTSWDLSQLKG